MKRETVDSSRKSIIDVVLQYIPKEAEVSRIEFEGPRLAIYTKKPEILLEQSYIITDLVNKIRKRVILRCDPSIRMNEEEAKKAIEKIVSPEAEITQMFFDPVVGEVIIEARKPGLVISKNGLTFQEIIKTTKWRPRVLRTPPISSKIIAHVRYYLYNEAEERKKILHDVGERIFRQPLHKGKELLITPLGGFQQVGRSAMLIRTRESMVLIDCGINPASTNPEEAYPRLDVEEFDVEALDAVVISHAHLDHCGLLPILFKYGYDGPIYCSEPTLHLMILLQLDYLDVLKREGKTLPYDQKDVREVVTHTIPVSFGVVTDISPDIRLTLHNSGHILGSSVVHLHIGDGLHNIVYTGDFKFMKTMLLEASSTTFPRVETLIMESTYGGSEDIMPPRFEVEQRFATIVNQTINNNGKVLIPVLAVGRAQEIMVVINEYMERGIISQVPVFIDGMINEVTAIHTAFPEHLSKELQNKILHEDVNPFQSEQFFIIKHASGREEVFSEKSCIILATSGMLEGGPALEYFMELAPDEKNTIMFVSYQIEGTLGRRILNGLREVSMVDSEGKIRVVKVKARVESVEGFSGHSDRNQLLNYVKRITPKPQRVIICHGEKSKSLSLSLAIEKTFKIKCSVPPILETTRVY